MIGALVAGVVLSVAFAVRPRCEPQAPGRVLTTWWRTGAAREVERALPELLEALARSLRAGVSAPVALGDAARGLPTPVVADMGGIQARLERGESFASALGAWAHERRDVAGVRLSAVAIVMAAEAGGSVARAIDGVADTLREDIELGAEVRALAAQANASAVVIAALPLLFLLLLAGSDPAALGFLVGSGLGRFCLVAGLLLQAAGFWWMRRIVRAIR